LFRIETNADDDDDDADMSAVEDEPSIIDKKDTKNTTAEEEQQDETTSEIGKLGVKAAWVDEDDQQNQISLMDRNRLRKLRRTEDETEIKGDEYQERLRQQ
jgi:U3 small nucleolar RNA-associated protein 18